MEIVMNNITYPVTKTSSRKSFFVNRSLLKYLAGIDKGSNMLQKEKAPHRARPFI